MNGSWLDRNRNFVFILLLFIAVGGAGVFYLRQPAQAPVEIRPAEEATATTVPTPLPSPTPAPVRVYVTGAVVNSDVYFLPAGSIIKDAIAAAGGFTLRPILSTLIKPWNYKTNSKFTCRVGVSKMLHRRCRVG